MPMERGLEISYSDIMSLSPGLKWKIYIQKRKINIDDVEDRSFLTSSEKYSESLPLERGRWSEPRGPADLCGRLTVAKCF